MTSKAHALAKLARFAVSYEEENPFAMHPATERDWEDAFEEAREDVQEAGATEEEVEQAGDRVGSGARQVLAACNQNRRQA